MPGGNTRVGVGLGSRTNSVTNIAEEEEEEEVPVGPLSGPSDLTWRRQRLLQIGSDRQQAQPVAEDTTLRPDIGRTTSYGTLPPSPTAKRSRSKLNLRRGLASLPGIPIPRTFTTSSTNSPIQAQYSPVSFRERSLFRGQRPISAYDRPVGAGKADAQGNDADVKTNGIRVWYSSFTSIDWLHDAIKDSARHGRLKRRKSTRGRLQRQLDRSVGWVIVTLVGFLTAIVAYMIVRSEQWLFDIKEGYCTLGWYRARRFCCPNYDVSDSGAIYPAFLSLTVDAACPNWRTWAQVFGPAEDGSTWINFEDWVVEYTVYALLAVRFNAIF